MPGFSTIVAPGRALVELLLPLGLAVVMGLTVGTERYIRGRPAGLRTYLLVCVSFTTRLLLDSRVVDEPMAYNPTFGDCLRVVPFGKNYGSGQFDVHAVLGMNSILPGTLIAENRLRTGGRPKAPGGWRSSPRRPTSRGLS
jgi:hypothetical protein